MRCIALSILLSLIAASLQDPAEIDRWIADLGHEEIARREEAQNHLAKAGEKALPALRRALESKDAEKVARVRRIIEDIERPIRERKHDLEQRRLQLQLYSVEFKDTRAEEVFRKLAELLGREFKSEADPDARVTYSAKQAPLRQILDAIEERLDVSIRDKNTHWDVSRLMLPRKPRAYAPGETIEFTVKAASVNGKRVGTRIRLSPPDSTSNLIDAWEVKGSDGQPRAIRRCEDCGPRLILVEGDPAELRIRLKGRIVWPSRYVLKVDRPDTRQTFIVGPYAVAYEFPGVTVSSREGVLPHLAPYASIKGSVKPGVEGPPIFGGRFAGRVGRKDPSKWCDCGPGPAPAIAKSPPEPATSWLFEDRSGLGAGDFESITVLFTKYFEEPFEADALLPVE